MNELTEAMVNGAIDEMTESIADLIEEITGNSVQLPDESLRWKIRTAIESHFDCTL